MEGRDRGEYKIQEVKGLEIDLLPPMTCLRSTDVTLVKWKVAVVWIVLKSVDFDISFTLRSPESRR